ncbi:MFS transporter [Halalkalibacter krulwichiae]|uniref:Enterobactin exporter EntS n=1 Tax=Halalkalibacter krulwichiae TaxID=199441 RepID=A0A1X9MIH9_9BACI|nr:MFS transporter [Halalkalibacter krulwichiae]ARK32604.1 Enterobactin exporter EntS [Halalkalibacter krulwichiae]
MSLKSELSSSFQPFHYKQYRYLWIGQLTTVSAQMMDMITRSWLIYSMTQSALQLSFVMALQALPLLFFGLMGGVLADRFDRRKLLLISQITNFVVNMLMGILLVAGWLEVWMVYTTSLLAGTAMAVQQPARNSIIPATVPRKSLQDAIVLNSSTLNIGQAAGPAIGGFIIAGMGISSTFFLQAALFLISIWMTIQMSSMISIPPKKKKKESIVTSIAQGLRYVRRNEIILSLLLLATVPLFFGNPVQSVIPIFAEDILKVGADGAGILLGAMGIGTIVSTLLLITLPTIKKPGRIIVSSTIFYGLFLLLFAISTYFWLSVCFMFLAGVCLALFRTLNQSMIISNTENEYLGRVNSIYLLDRGMVPLGIILLGILSEYWTVVFGVGMMSVLCILVTLLTLIKSKALWRVEEKQSEETYASQ